MKSKVLLWTFLVVLVFTLSDGTQLGVKDSTNVEIPLNKITEVIPLKAKIKKDSRNKTTYGDCCNTLEFKSSGGLAEGGQKHLLGKYTYDEDGEEGTKIYYQPGNGGGDPSVWLYYLDFPWYMWFINNHKGEGQGYAFIYDDEPCPESLPHKWLWYSSEEGDMVTDETAEMVCSDGPNPTDPPPPPSDCCNELIFESTGSISDSIQEHVLGSYEYHSEGIDGTRVYKHTERGDYLYYIDYGWWYIGPNVGENMGYALNDNAAACPEKLPKSWAWADSDGGWTDDDIANFRCR